MSMAGWFWLIAWGLWWLIIALGAQGTAPVLGLIGLLALPILFRKRPSFSLDAIVFFVFLLWCIATGFWTDIGDKQLLIWDPANENFAIESPGARLAFVGTLGAFAFWSLHQLSDKMYERTRWAAVVGLGIVAAMMMFAIFGLQVFRDLAFAKSQSTGSVQNLIRSLNLTILAIPLFVALLPIAKNTYKMALIAGFLLVAMFIAYQFGSMATFLVGAFLFVSAGAVYAFGRKIFFVLGIITAIAVVVTPTVLTGVSNAVQNRGATDFPPSIEARFKSNDFVLEKLQSRWLIGWGVDAAKNWDDTVDLIVDGKTYEMKTVPNHPHNMSLHVWVETGAVGAVLLAMFAFLFGRRLSRSMNPDPYAVFAGVALWVGVLTYGSYSYSLWNDGFWTGIAFVGSGLLLLPSRRKLAEQTS